VQEEILEKVGGDHHQNDDKSFCLTGYSCTIFLTALLLNLLRFVSFVVQRKNPTVLIFKTH